MVKFTINYLWRGILRKASHVLVGKLKKYTFIIFLLSLFYFSFTKKAPKLRKKTQSSNLEIHKQRKRTRDQPEILFKNCAYHIITLQYRITNWDEKRQLYSGILRRKSGPYISNFYYNKISSVTFLVNWFYKLQLVFYKT